MIKGIDISNYQSGLNFTKAKDMGFEICIIKATESVSYTNLELDTQVRSAQNAGMEIGFYHFFRNKGLDEARYFISKIKPYLSIMKIKPVIDIEVSYTDEEVLTFINTVEETLGTECMIYCNYSYCKSLKDNSEIAKKTLWLAYYGNDDGDYYEAPSNLGFATFGGQQYASKNYIGSINVDMNLFTNNVYLENATKVNDSNDTGTVYYTVVKGDTLTQIAKKYNTTVENLVSINGLNNPGLIKIGQVLVVKKVSGDSAKYYTVISGDTLSSIARAYGTTYKKIAELNNLSNPNLIKPGMVIRVL